MPYQAKNSLWKKIEHQKQDLARCYLTIEKLREELVAQKVKFEQAMDSGFEEAYQMLLKEREISDMLRETVSRYEQMLPKSGTEVTMEHWYRLGDNKVRIDG